LKLKPILKLKSITLKLKSPILKHFEAKIYIIYINLCKRFSLLWLPFGSFFTLTHSCIINVGVLYQYKATFTQSIFLYQDFYLLKPVFFGKDMERLRRLTMCAYNCLDSRKSSF